VPVDITSGESDKPELLAHLDLLQQISSIDSADFLPSPNAVLQKSARSTLIVPEDFIDTNSPSPRVRPISRPQPDYPEAARAANVHGIVKLRTTIGSDGHIAGVHVISGPPQLQNAAVDAVWRWTFEPPWHSEGPAQVITVFSVKF
jgi:TonB family protein